MLKSSFLICNVNGKPNYYINGIHVYDGEKIIIDPSKIANCTEDYLSILSMLEAAARIFEEQHIADDRERSQS